MPLPNFNESQMDKCLKEVEKKDGRSLREISRQFGIGESSIRLRLKRKQNVLDGVPKPKMGRPTVISKEEERVLADCVGVLCKNGFSPTLKDIQCYVGEYCIKNNVVTPFTDGIPGRRWLERFMINNELSLKKATMISKVRLDCTSNPFMVYDFYDKLEDVIKTNNLSSGQIWNMDETAFPMDPKKQMSVAPKGKKAFKQQQGSGRENVTVLGVASASGEVLSPLIIHQGENFQQSWRAPNSLPYTYYGKSKKGWMTSEVMLEWFDLFIKQVTVRPLLLLFDGHLTHFSIDVIRKAIANDIILIKLPPHVTDILQPLDVGMFSPLKKAWEKCLNENTGLNGDKIHLDKSTFASMLCSIWKEGMPAKNAIAGFRTTGIFPLDATKYPTDRFKQKMLSKYRAWVEAGKPNRSDFEENDPPVCDAAADTGSIPPILSSPTCSISSVSSTSSVEDMEIPAIPYEAPQGFRWKLQLVLEKIHSSPETPSSTSVSPANQSFEEVIISLAKPATTGKKEPRKQLGFGRTVVSDEDFVTEIERRKEEDRLKAEKKQQRKEAREAKKAAKEDATKMKKAKVTPKNFRKRLREMVDDDTEDEDDDEGETLSDNDDDVNFNIEQEEKESEEDEKESADDENESEEDEKEKEDDDLEILTAPTTETVDNYLGEVWDKYNLPTEENDIIHKYVGGIFHGDLYVGKVKRRFLRDEGGVASALELNCLKLKHGVSDNIMELRSAINEDIDIFPMHDIISKPLKVIPLRGNKLEVPAYYDLHKSYCKVKNLERSKHYDSYVCKKYTSMEV